MGHFTGRAGEKRYGVVRQSFAGGRAEKLVAKELGGADYVSLNLYRLAGGVRLRPCEMPEEKVVRFVLVLVPE